MKQMAVLALLSLIGLGSRALAGAAKEAGPEPTKENVSYGPDERNVMDFWKAAGEGPRPVVISIHGGGWLNGDKRSARNTELKKLLDMGISVVAINYRLSGKNPLPAPVHDAARAVQFVRFMSKEWNIDPARVALTGGSAGGCSTLWIALHDDMQDKNSPDPVLRESSRVTAAVADAAQTSIDPKVITDWIGPKVIDHAMIRSAVGSGSNQDMTDNYAKYEKLYKEFSPINHVDKNDPPILLRYSFSAPPKGTNEAIHHANFGIKLKEASDKVGHECYLYYPGGPASKYRYAEEFLKAKLLAK